MICKIFFKKLSVVQLVALLIVLRPILTSLALWEVTQILTSARLERRATFTVTCTFVIPGFCEETVSICYHTSFDAILKSRTPICKVSIQHTGQPRPIVGNSRFENSIGCKKSHHEIPIIHHYFRIRIKNQKTTLHIVIFVLDVLNFILFFKRVCFIDN